MATGLAQLVEVRSAASMEEAARAARAAHDAQQASPLIQGLAAHVRKRWELAKQAKITPENRLLQCLRQRSGEYDPDKLAKIKEIGGSEIYMQLTSTKCRGAASWLRDALLGTGTDKPWTLDSTPIPDLPPEVLQMAQAAMQQAIQMVVQNTGQPPSTDAIKQEWERMRDAAMRHLHDEAQTRVDRMEKKMEDQLCEGRFIQALADFVDDLVTFPTAIIKGPVPRKRKTLEWKGKGLVPVEKTVLEWERVDPFMAYPAPWASSPHDGFFIERHKLTREDVESMIGLDGFDEAALRTILANFGTSMTETLSVDSQVAAATEKSGSEATRTQDVIDGLQLWDSVQGKLLTEWGMKGDVDPEKSYPSETWLIGSVVVKAVLNYDPLGRKPYYAASYEKTPGSFWGRGVADLIRDCQAMCNAAARALSNNMGISSGPQVGVNVSRLPPGESISKMYPWKIWQFQNSDYQDAAKPLDFFQPNSNAQELMAVFEKYQTLADEYSGIPRYMTGENTPGAGRTASGLSMMISNASKSIKSVIFSIDQHVITPLLERLYQHNLRYAADPDLIGDINIVAKGAMSLVAKESAAVRRNEMLQVVLNSPLAQEIVGPLGAAELLRENARLLDINVDKIVPSPEALQEKVRVAQEQAQAMQQQALQMQQQALAVQGGEKQAKAVQQQFDNGIKVKKLGLEQRKVAAQLLPDGSKVGGRDANTQRNVVTGKSG